VYEVDQKGLTVGDPRLCIALDGFRIKEVHHYEQNVEE
jgi:hypothetical protein